MDTDLTTECFALEENTCTIDQSPTKEFIKSPGKECSEGGGGIQAF